MKAVGGSATIVFAIAAALATLPAASPTVVKDSAPPARRRLPVKLEAPGLHNLFRLSEHVYSGSSPEGAEGFESLRKLGVRTIVSVDGARPEAARARSLGMRYAHLPIGYDGIGADDARRLALASGLPVPIYVHCHHGKHRGPAAAALVCMTAAGWTPAEGEAWLHAAGTAPDYAGLWRSVHDFAPPAGRPPVDPEDFPEIVEPPELVDAMLTIDEQWDTLKRSASASDAVTLVEAFRELSRLEADRGAEFVQASDAAVEACERLRRALAMNAADAELPQARAAVERSCKQCHARFRDAPPTPASPRRR